MSLEEVCRACLRTGRTMCSLLESIAPKFDSPSKAVVDLWKIFNKMLISYEDMFPNKICSECLDEIQRTYKFLQKCERSEDILKEMKILNSVSTMRGNDSPKNIKIENYMQPNITQIKTENIEWDGFEEEGKGRSHYEEVIDESHQEDHQRLQQPSFVQHDDPNSEELEQPDCEIDMEDDASATQVIKEEPELLMAESEDQDENDSDNDCSTEVFKCPACRYECSMVDGVEKHIIEKHMEQQLCKLCDEEFKCTALEHCSLHRHLYVNCMDGDFKYKSIKYHNCKACSKIFTAKSTLNRHLKTHTAERPFKCELCPKTFRHKRNLAEHLRSHTGERPFKCEVCPKTFRQKFALTDHFRCHTGERPYECEICPKKFRQKNTLTDHLRCHSGERPYKCELCTKAFRHKNNLTRHLRCHREKPLKCEFCPKSFPHKFALTDHLISHTKERPFKCDICPKAFQQKHTLTDHLRCHTGERPFNCEICSSSFRQKNNLMRHIRTHTEKNEKYEKYDAELKAIIRAHVDSKMDQRKHDAKISQG